MATSSSRAVGESSATSGNLPRASARTAAWVFPAEGRMLTLRGSWLYEPPPRYYIFWMKEDHHSDAVIYPALSHELSRKRQELAPETEKAFQAFSKQVFSDGALNAKTKQLIAVAVAHVTQCPYCIKGHTKAALRAGARPEELMEAIWVAAEMRAGGAYAHANIALAAMEAAQAPAPGESK
jgi:AhpD family alkylhydroperoxidase